MSEGGNFQWKLRLWEARYFRAGESQKHSGFDFQSIRAINSTKKLPSVVNVVKADLKLFTYQCDNKCNAPKCCLMNHYPVPIFVVTLRVSEQLQCSSCPSRAMSAETQGQISCFTRPKPEVLILFVLTRRHPRNLWLPPPGKYWRPKQFPHTSQPIFSTPTERTEVGINPVQVSSNYEPSGNQRAATSGASTRCPPFSPTHHKKLDGYVTFMTSDGGATKNTKNDSGFFF